MGCQRGKQRKCISFHFAFELDNMIRTKNRKLVADI
jgi:hypothetical protein